MKISKFYSNQPTIFEPINFTQGLNVILAEIRLPENRKKDTHNLGKTTLGRLLDFGFLSRSDQKFFLLKHYDLFKNFIFFLEIELTDTSYITVRRSVENPSKISIKKHETKHQDFSGLEQSAWDHWEIPFERTRKLLNSLLDWHGLEPRDYRKGLGYQIRTQNDFQDVFQLGKFAAGKHLYWKPFMAHILGFNAQIIKSHYEKEEEIKTKVNQENTIKSELGGGKIEDISKIDGMLLLKTEDAKKKKKLLDEFDFRVEDLEKTKLLIDEVDFEIATLNSRRYSLNQNRKKILSSLQDGLILFKTDEAQRLFQEAGVLFSGQIKKDFEQLIAFNQAITQERRVYLQSEYNDIETELQSVNADLNTFGKRRSEALSFLSSTDIFEKYKQVSDDLVTTKAEIISLSLKRDFFHRLQDLRSEIRKLTEEKNSLQVQIENDVEKQNGDTGSFFSSIRLYFSEIIEEVIDRKALLSVSPNSEGHLEFKAEILDDSGNTTSADLGNSYRKLLCIAFDLAILRANTNVRFPRFVYHDGVFESLDDRKKENLLSVLHTYVGYGIQSIITTIDTDLPPREISNPVFDSSEIVLTLHDENEQGRLFRMKSW